MKSLGLAALMLLTLRSALIGAPVSCAIPGAISSGCIVSKLLFDNFSIISAPPGVTVTSDGAGVGDGNGVGQKTDVIGFLISTPSAPANITFSYRVSNFDSFPAIVGVTTLGLGALEFGFNPDSWQDATLTETVCAIAPMQGVCPAGAELAFLNYTQPNISVSALSSHEQQIWAIVSISEHSSTSNVGEVVNGHIFSFVPEPENWAIVGLGLLIIVLSRCVTRLKIRSLGRNLLEHRL